MAMNENQIHDALEQSFNADGHRIVFWNDDEGGFNDDVESMLPDGVELIRLPGPAMLAVKIRMEIEEADQKFLVYDTREEPPLTEDWLLDIREYSYRFTADRASVMLGELGLERMSLREHLKRRDPFMASKQRVARLKSLVESDDLEEDLDRKMIAVLTRAATPDLGGILRRLFPGLVDPETGGLDHLPTGWKEIGKLGLEAAFWRQVEQAFGYSDESPNLKSLLLRVVISDLVQQAGDAIQGFDHLVLPEHGSRQACVFLAQWGDSQSQGQDYDAVVREAEVALHLKQTLNALGLEVVRDLNTVPCTEGAVLRSLVTQIREQWQTPDTEEWLEIARAREEGRWVRPGAPPDSDWRAFHQSYRAVRAAVGLINVWCACREQTWPDNLEGMWQAYETEWWKIDQAYRHFNESAERVERHNWDILKGLRATVDDIYVNGYIAKLGLDWGDRVAVRLGQWKVAGVPTQHEFFKQHVQPRLDQGPKQKAMVIISDAFRFEAAKELVEDLNSRYRFEAELESQLGVVPSYTALGMASLLPHNTLAYAPDGKTLRVDGKPASSTEQRNTILASHEGIAIQAEELLGLTKSEGRARIEGARLVYVYHNRIDAVGDSGGTEEQAFEATHQAIEELSQLVSKAVNDLNFKYVLVTADHGYLCTHCPPKQTSKSSLAGAPAGALVTKKRYVVGNDLPEIDEAWRGSTAATAGTEPGLDFWVPKGANVFHFVGGARFLHGGAMPQEIVVPVLRARALRGSKAESTRTGPVTLQILGGPHRITTGRHRFTLMQLKPVSDRVLPVTARVDLRDGETPISDSETVTFDSASESYDDRTRQIVLTLKNLEFDRKKLYKLAVRDVETGITHTYADVHIDRAFTDDF